MSLKTVNTNKMDLISDAYFGVGGFDPLSGYSYLVRAEKELEEDYVKRVKSTHYTNYFRQVVDANISSVFLNVIRITKNKNLLAFYEDCDKNGTAFSEFMENAGIEAELYGSSVLFLDAPEDIPSNVGEYISTGSYPNAFRLNPKEIIQYSLEGENNLTYLYFKIGEYSEGVPEYAIYDDGMWYKGTKTTNGELVAYTSGVEAISKPIILTFESYPDPWTLPPSRYGSTAQISKTLYNYEGLINRQANDATFSILWNPNAPLEDNATFSMHTIWNSKAGGKTDGAQTKPEFLTPENSIEELRNQVDALKTQIYESTNMNVLSTSSDASGASRAYSDVIRIEGLQKRSRCILEAEIALINYFAVAVNETVEYFLEYPVEFAASASPEEQLNNLNVVKSSGVSELATSMINLKMMKILFPTMTADEYKKLEVAETSMNTEFDDNP